MLNYSVLARGMEEGRAGMEMRWQELKSEFELLLFLIEAFLDQGPDPLPAPLPDRWLERLRAYCQQLREAWEREWELHNCDMVALFG